jgi:hypothetical protein
MYALAELDRFFEPTEEHLQECAAAFFKSPRVDTSLVTGHLDAWS